MKRLILLAALALASFTASAQSVPGFTPVTRAVPTAITASAQTVAVPAITYPLALYKLYVAAFGTCTGAVTVTFDGSTASMTNGGINAMTLGPNTGFVQNIPATLANVSVIGNTTGCTLYMTVGV